MSTRKNARKFKLELIEDNEAVSRHPKYGSWKQLKLKCKKEGIELCKEWNDAETYLKWIEDNAEDKKVLYRRDLNGAYSPKNCYFATVSEVNKRKKQAQPKPKYRGTPADYVLPRKEKWGMTNGYYHFCDSAHPLAQKAGWVYVHMHMGSLKKGRWVRKGEEVHHIDEDRLNNDLSNLKVLSKKEHMRLHGLKDGGRRLHGYRQFTYREYGLCCVCGEKFKKHSIKAKYCSNKCRGEDNTKINWPSKEEMINLMNNNTQGEVAKLLGVSDQAVYKRCKKIGIK